MVLLHTRLLLFLLAAIPRIALAQQTTITTRVPLVVVPASVTDRRNHFVYGLEQSDFLVLDNDRLVPVTVDDPDVTTAPFDIAVLIQTSDIADSALLKIKKTAAVVGNAVLGANGSAAIITFGDTASLAQDFTTGPDALSAAFSNLKSTETREGRLLDAIGQALSLLSKRSNTKRSAIAILGESEDRGSETKLPQILDRLSRSPITIYSLNYSAYLTAFTTKGSEYKPPQGGNGWILDTITETAHAAKQDTCKILTEVTGGRQLKFETQSKLENDLIRVGAELHGRYVISFTPPEGSEPP